MFIGPLFAREVVGMPRRARHYLARAGYVAALWLLMVTGWLILSGARDSRTIGTTDLAQFSRIVFQLLGPLQLAIVVFFSALAAASSVALEKDRRTLDLLLLTNLTNSQLVLGKLLGSLLQVLVLLAAAAPLLFSMTLLGGVDFGQAARVVAVTAIAALAAGSLGSTLAFWREKTFQTLAMTTLALVCWVAVWEAVAWRFPEHRWAGRTGGEWAAIGSPWRALQVAMLPSFAQATASWRSVFGAYLLAQAGLLLLLNGWAIWRVRVWNPTREIRLPADGAQSADAALQAAPAAPDQPRPVQVHGVRPGRSRAVWDNPVLWREIRTWAYGRKVLLVRLAYVVLWAAASWGLWRLAQTPGLSSEALRYQTSLLLGPLLVISLLLVNAQAVTALTSERDAKALDVLLVTDVSPREFVWGKVLGALYNSKEMVLLPALTCVALAARGFLDLESLCLLLGSLAVVYFFATTLGLHAGMQHANSRTAIAASLGTVFFLFVGVAACIRIMLAFEGLFQFQLQPFLAFMVGGAFGLNLVLGTRNPSTAISLAAWGCPFFTFYAITSFLQNQPVNASAAVALIYGFASLALLIPAIHEFDVATGRTTGGDEG